MPGTEPETQPRRWRGMDRDERDAQRHGRLVQAGLEAFGTDGYATTTIEGLCARANVATRSFYELFGSREALLRAVYDDVIEAVAVDMAGVFADDDAPVDEVVRRGVACYLEPLVGDERRGRVTQLEAVGVGELETHRRAVIQQFAALIAARIERWMAAGAIPRRELGLLPLIMAGGVSEALVDHLMHPADERCSLEALIDEVTRVWLVVLGLA